MAKQTINVGTAANDGTGDTLRAAAQKINSNFTEVYGKSQAAFDKANTSSGSANTANITFSDTTVGTVTSNTDIVLSTIFVDPTASPAIDISNSWTFGKDGRLTVPGVISGMEVLETWTENITAIDIGELTLVTITTNRFGGPVAGQIRISGVNGTVESNRTWYYQAWESNQIRLFNDVGLNDPVDSTTWTAYVDGGTATDITGGGVSIEANYNVWDFQSNGNLIAPGNIIVGGGNNSNGNEQHFIIDADNYWTSIQWKNFSQPQDPNDTPFECQAQLLRVFANENTVTAWCNPTNPREELVALTAIRPTTTNYNGLMFSTSDTKIPDAPYNDGAGIRHDWILHGDGTTQLPNMPTNARTGNADALIFTKMNGRTGQKAIGTQGGNETNQTVERLIIAGGDSYYDGTNYHGEGGDLYLWAGRGADGGDIKVDAGNALGTGGELGGDVKIRGGSSQSGNGGFVEIDAGQGIGQNGGYVVINGGYGAVNGGDITITAGHGDVVGGQVRISSSGGAENWDFDANGAINLAGYGVIRGPAGGMGPVNIVSNMFAQLEWSANASSIDPNDASGPKNWIFVDQGGVHIENINVANYSLSWNFDTDGQFTLPQGSSIKDVPTSTVVNGFDLTTQDLGDFVSGPLDGVTYTTTGWDYIQFVQADLFNRFVALNGGNITNFVAPVTWADNTTGYVFVEFLDESSTLQFAPSDAGAGSPVPGVYTFPARFGTADVVTVAGVKVSVNGNEWDFNNDGTTKFPGSVVNSSVVAGSYFHDPVYPQPIDVTKTINKLSDNSGSWYTLADGTEGQILYLVRKHDVTDLSLSSIAIHVANAYYGVNQLTDQVLYFDKDIITLIFTDGAWQQTGGLWD